jgi:hypothetical protein
MKPKFKQGDVVLWNFNDRNMKVRVCGIATREQPVIGSIYIVELPTNTEIPNYEYSHAVALESNLRKVV